MSIALLLVLAAAISSLFDWLGLLIRHVRAYRRAKKFVWPPRTVMATTLNDEIPWE